MTHKEAKKLLENKSEVRLAASTFLSQKDDNYTDYTVEYYETPIVVIKEGGEYTLNSNGHKGPSTKNRINMIIKGEGFKVAQRNLEWFLLDEETDESIPFNDFMSFKTKRFNIG